MRMNPKSHPFYVNCHTENSWINSMHFHSISLLHSPKFSHNLFQYQGEISVNWSKRLFPLFWYCWREMNDTFTQESGRYFAACQILCARKETSTSKTQKVGNNYLCLGNLIFSSAECSLDYSLMITVLIQEVLILTLHFRLRHPKTRCTELEKQRFREIRKCL